MFRLLLLVLIAIPAGAWFFPQITDGGDSPCAAMERRIAIFVAQEIAKHPAAGDKLASQLLAQAQDSARAIVHEKFPHLPRNIACAAGWWQMYRATDMRAVASK